MLHLARSVDLTASPCAVMDGLTDVLEETQVRRYLTV
jgi:hypothetical protein